MSGRSATAAGETTTPRGRPAEAAVELGKTDVIGRKYEGKIGEERR
jgi:hypothetical protein